MPAPVAAAPATAEIEATLAAGYVSVHCTAAGSLPDGEVRVRLSETAPFVAAVPEDSDNASVCPKQLKVDSKKAVANERRETPVDLGTRGKLTVLILRVLVPRLI